jgi:hypothetical protein
VKGRIEQDVSHLNADHLDLIHLEKIRAQTRSPSDIIDIQDHIIKKLKEVNQQLRDEVARLKGEKGKPKILPNVPDIPRDNSNHQVGKSKTWKKKAKRTRVKIDRVQKFCVDRSILPDDAIPKGFRSVVIQDIIFKTCNVECLLERFYSPSLKKTFEAKLPKDLQGTSFGSCLKAFAIILHNLGRVTENKIQKILEGIGIIISEGTISNIMIEEKRDEFTAEKNAIFKNGMENADYFQIDDTGARHAGKNHYLDVVCNDQFSSFFILGGKSKDDLRPIFGLKEGEQIDKPMISDAAQQFRSISSKQGLCWIHEIRHYRKLTPVFDQHRALLNDFIDRLWYYYELLEDYKENPDCGLRVYLEWLFDSIFLSTTGYVMLDETIASTRKRKDRLLKVLIYPELPLHNNGSEIALREGVIKRKISYGTRSEAGKAAWENQLTILDTCRKQGVSYFEYILDIISGSYSMPRLSQHLMRSKSSTAY